jgi:DNA-binding LacI/PurR family transcriptional regulator
LQLQDPPTAIFYFNDESSYYGQQAIKDSGLSVPKDISIIGFDDTDFSHFADVDVTTFPHPKQKLGKQAVDVLLRMINGEKFTLENRIIHIEPKIIERNSVAFL